MLTALQSDVSRILVELCNNSRSISIVITVGKAVGIANLVTRKVFFCSATRMSSITKSHLVPYMFIGKNSRSISIGITVGYADGLASLVTRNVVFLLSDEDVFDHEVAPRAIHLHRQKSAQAGFLLSDH